MKSSSLHFERGLWGVINRAANGHRWALLLAVSCTLLGETLFAETSVARIFGSHMVLQQGKAIPVWGWDDPGQVVSVTLGDLGKEATADDDGRWEVEFDAMPVNAEGLAMKAQGSSLVEFEDILVGEVWLASGQSNMGWSVKKSMNAEKEIPAANYSEIRLFKVAQVPAGQPARDIPSDHGWRRCHPETVPDFSGTAYFFGRELHQVLGVPVGLIDSSWGGSHSEAWTRLGALEGIPEAEPLLDQWKKRRASYDEKVAKAAFEASQMRYEVKAAIHERTNEALRDLGRPEQRGVRRANLDLHPDEDTHSPGVLYNGMIAPLVPYAIRGVIWNQGEGNVGRTRQFQAIFPALIQDWRAQWGEEFPFYFGQLANLDYLASHASGWPGVGPYGWRELQWAQFTVARDSPRTEMVVINDIGDPDDIHPRNKQEAGRRYAQLALAYDYDQGTVPCGPVYAGSEVKEGGIELRFQHVGEGLRSRDGEPLRYFLISGEDGIWLPAEANMTSSDRILVKSEKVSDPVAVRYAWLANPEKVNLVNSADLPASMFRTDDWALEGELMLNPFRLWLQTPELPALGGP